jgi:hypothetical protein
MLEKFRLGKKKQEPEQSPIMEVTLPNGQLLVVMKTLNKYNPVNIADIEEKLKLIERAGIQNYEFGKFIDGKLKDASFEILRDILIYHSIGWIEVNKENTACMFTQKGLMVAERMKVPDIIHDQFYSVFDAV